MTVFFYSPCIIVHTAFSFSPVALVLYLHTKNEDHRTRSNLFHMHSKCYYSNKITTEMYPLTTTYYVIQPHLHLRKENLTRGSVIEALVHMLHIQIQLFKICMLHHC